MVVKEEMEEEEVEKHEVVIKCKIMSEAVQEERKEMMTCTEEMMEIKEFVKNQIESLWNLQRENNDVELTKEKEEEEELVMDTKGSEEDKESMIINKIEEENEWETEKKVADEKKRVQLKLKEEQRRKKQHNKRIWNTLF